ncbi:MAG: histidine kinase [Bacteroidia bacterium]|nr:hypothetical protein [Bacteroidia bacterium]MCZ2276773.1 histidine kinase [Bacteroidia bacterium]
MPKLLYLGLLLCLPGILPAQLPFSYSYSMDEGLPSERVFCSAQDKAGFIWFGTDVGLTMFNGKDFITYTEVNGLASNEISRLYNDKKGRLWIFHPDGKLSMYSDGRFFNEKNNQLINRIQNKKIASTIIEDVFGNLWFGYKGGALARLSVSDALLYFASPMPGEISYAPEFYLTSDNELWIIYSSRFFSYDYESDEFILLLGPVILSSDRLIYHFISNSNAVFLTTKGIERMINKNYGVVISSQRIPAMEKSAYLFYDDFNNIWFSNRLDNTFLFKYDRGTYRQARPVLEQVRVTSFFSDRESNVWVTTNGSGVYRYAAPGLSLEFITKAGGLPSESISRLLAYGEDLIAITDQDKAVVIKKQNVIPIIPFNEKQAGKLSVDSDTDKKIAIFLKGNRLYLYRNDNLRTYDIKELTNSPGSISPSVSLVAFSKDHSCFITQDSVIFKLDLRKGNPILKHYYTLSRNRIITHLKTCGTDSLILMTGQTIYALRNELIQLTSEITHPVTDFQMLGTSLLVATSGAGLLVFRDGKIRAMIDSVNHIPMSFVKRITVSSEKVIWLSAQNGLFRFVLNNDVPQVVEHFTSVDGLLSESVNDVLLHNKIYIAGYKGINYFENSLTKQINEPPAVYIKEFWYGDQKIKLNDSLSFKFKKYPLHIEFESPVYQNSNRVLFQYKLNGFNEEWTVTENTIAEYSSLNPGSYIFQVQAKRAGSGWSKPVFIKFEIIAPFYGTLWFRLIVANTLIFMLYIVLRNIASAKFRKKLAVFERTRALEQERNRISRDMHDDLGADLTNIVILSKIARQTIKPQANERDTIDRIETAANDVINKMNEIIWALNPSNDSLPNLVSYLHRYIKEYLELNRVEFSVEIPERIPAIRLKAGFRRNIFLVVKETLHNIVKHSRASRVTVVIEPEKMNRFVLSINDDGIGFNVEERMGTGNGLLNMRKRMKEITGLYEISSFPAKGTKVRIEALLPG